MILTSDIKTYKLVTGIKIEENILLYLYLNVLAIQFAIKIF